ncbi:hypothetical protein BJX70DRAFT_9465 [Aspergillus crustosus]
MWRFNSLTVLLCLHLIGLNNANVIRFNSNKDIHTTFSPSHAAIPDRIFAKRQDNNGININLQVEGNDFELGEDYDNRVISSRDPARELNDALSGVSMMAATVVNFMQSPGFSDSDEWFQWFGDDDRENLQEIVRAAFQNLRSLWSPSNGRSLSIVLANHLNTDEPRTLGETSGTGDNSVITLFPLWWRYPTFQQTVPAVPGTGTQDASATITRSFHLMHEMFHLSYILPDNLNADEEVYHPQECVNLDSAMAIRNPQSLAFFAHTVFYRHLQFRPSNMPRPLRLTATRTRRPVIRPDAPRPDPAPYNEMGDFRPPGAPGWWNRFSSMFQSDAKGGGL